MNNEENKVTDTDKEHLVKITESLTEMFPGKSIHAALKTSPLSYFNQAYVREYMSQLSEGNTIDPGEATRIRVIFGGTDKLSPIELRRYIYRTVCGETLPE